MRDLPRNFHSFEHGSGKAPRPKLLIPAYIILPLLRAPLGYELVRPRVMIPRALLVLFLGFWPPALYISITGTGHLLPPHEWARAHPVLAEYGIASYEYAGMAGFTLLAFAASFLVFLKRWTRQRRGEEVHTAEAGYSWLARLLPFPVEFTEMALVPACLVGARWWVAERFSVTLGAWFAVSAFSLFIMAHWEYRRRWSQHRATTDDVVRAESYGQRLEKREERARRSSPAAEQPDFADLASPARRARRQA